MEDKVRYITFTSLTLVDKEHGARLKWGVRMGFPRLTVEPEPKKEGEKYGETIINAPFTYPTFFYFLDRFEEVIQGEPGSSFSIECRNTKYVDGKKTNETYLQAKVIVGKDKEGIIFISVIEEGKKKIKFDLLPDTKWYKMFKNGEEITDKKDLSYYYAISYIKTVRAIYTMERMEENVRISYVDRPNNGNNYRRPPEQWNKPVEKVEVVEEIVVPEEKLMEVKKPESVELDFNL